MPRGDGTGPLGAGPMTGRVLGNRPTCRTPAFGLTPGWTRGCGRHASRGWGPRAMGFWPSFAPALSTVEEERAVLQRQLGVIQANLAAIDNLMEERNK